MFVRGAIASVLREAAIAALLVSVMVMLFLGNWRAVAVILHLDPAGDPASLVGLKLSRQSINLMTLGGLALAIGMLVDDATVEIENIERNRRGGLGLTAAILAGASQVALPAIMATLAICVVIGERGVVGTDIRGGTSRKS